MPLGRVVTYESVDEDDGGVSERDSTDAREEGVRGRGDKNRMDARASVARVFAHSGAIERANANVGAGGGGSRVADARERDGEGARAP